jgi:hypothetical protein
MSNKINELDEQAIEHDYIPYRYTQQQEYDIHRIPKKEADSRNPPSRGTTNQGWL